MIWPGSYIATTWLKVARSYLTASESFECQCVTSNGTARFAWACSSRWQVVERANERAACTLHSSLHLSDCRSICLSKIAAGLGRKWRAPTRVLATSGSLIDQLEASRVQQVQIGRRLTAIAKLGVWSLLADAIDLCQTATRSTSLGRAWFE